MPNTGTPTRFEKGISTDAAYGPLAKFGQPHPFAYHYFEDDFDLSPGVSGYYTATKTGNGTIAGAAGDGGRALFTTNSSTPASGDVCSIQLPVAGFKMVLGYRAWFMTRLQLADVTNPAILVGLIQTTTTPFTVTDGIYITKASGSTNLVANHAVGSSITGTATVPAAANPLANNTDIDLAFHLNRAGEVEVFVGSNLIFVPQSGTGAVNSAGVSVLPVDGPVARFSIPTLTTANLNLTVAVQSGTATSKTMNADFVMAAKER